MVKYIPHANALGLRVLAVDHNAISLPPGVVVDKTGTYTAPFNGSGGSLRGMELTASLPLDLFADARRVRAPQAGAAEDFKPDTPLAQVGSARAAIVSVAFCSFLWLMAGLGLLGFWRRQVPRRLHWDGESWRLGVGETLPDAISSPTVSPCKLGKWGKWGNGANAGCGGVRWDVLMLVLPVLAAQAAG